MNTDSPMHRCGSPLPGQLQRNQSYVEPTRGMDHLAVTWAGRSAFTDRVSRSTRAVPIEG